MPAQLTSAFSRLTASVRAFSVAQRTIAIIGVAVLVLGIVALTSWLGRPSYTPLFSGLEAADANAIVEQLQADGVAYELADGGASILVPEESVYDERLKAAAAGLPSSSDGGYSLLDDMGVTSSEFQQSITYKRALEGELAATVAAVKGVKNASVRLAIPEETVFVSEQSNPTASVFIETDTGVTLDADQVQAIVHLTSASIDGMKPLDVAVVDAEGTVLSAVGTGANGSADDRASEHEDRVRTAVEAMLDRVLGPGNASVVVAADVNQESAERVEETFEAPEDALALSESIDRESRGGAGDLAAGVLGPDNIAVPDDVEDGVYASERTNRTNAVNKVTESRTIPAGSIQRQTVSVAIDAAAGNGIDVAEMTSLVETAAGVDAGRGDEVAIEVVNFNRAGAAEAAEALALAEREAANERFDSIVRTAIVTAGIAIPVIIALIIFARRSRRQEREPVGPDVLADILTAPTVQMTLPAPPVPLQLQPVSPDAPDESNAVDRARAEIGVLADNDPEKAAEYLRGFMEERSPA